MSRLVTIECAKLDPNECYGVILAQSTTLTLLHRVDDFQFDGYVAVRNRDVTRCDSSESDDYYRTIMRREGLWETAPRSVKKLSVEGWPEMLAGLVGNVVILEDEVRESFHIGPLLETHAKHAAIHYFDGCGRLQDVEKVCSASTFWLPVPLVGSVLLVVPCAESSLRAAAGWST
jgi:hypothetical protein